MFDTHFKQHQAKITVFHTLSLRGSPSERQQSSFRIFFMPSWRSGIPWQHPRHFAPRLHQRLRLQPRRHSANLDQAGVQERDVGGYSSGQSCRIANLMGPNSMAHCVSGFIREGTGRTPPMLISSLFGRHHRIPRPHGGADDPWQMYGTADSIVLRQQGIDAAFTRVPLGAGERNFVGGQDRRYANVARS
jgi:hypothetical protein